MIYEKGFKPFLNIIYMNKNRIPTPNKVFVLTCVYKSYFNSGLERLVLLIAAESVDVAESYFKSVYKIDETPDRVVDLACTWIMGASYQTIYEQNGENPKEVQASILFVF